MPLRVYRRGEIWWIGGTVNGQRVRQSARTGDKATASRIASEIEGRLWKAHLDGPETVVTFAAAAALYLQAGKPERYIHPLTDYWRATPLSDITAGHIRQAALTLYPKHKGSTRNRSVIVPAQAVINHAAELELCQRIHVRRFLVETKEKTPATWEWVQAFMESSNPHLGALVCFMFATGARIGEALALSWDDVDFKNRRVLIRQTKIGDERWAHLPGPLFEVMANLERCEPVFRYKWPKSVRDQMEKVTERAGIEPLTPHCCRHGFATTLLHAGVDVKTIARLGGWKDARHVLQTYGHALDDATITERLIGAPAVQPTSKALIKKA